MVLPVLPSLLSPVTMRIRGRAAGSNKYVIHMRTGVEANRYYIPCVTCYLTSPVVAAAVAAPVDLTSGRHLGSAEDLVRP